MYLNFWKQPVLELFAVKDSLLLMVQLYLFGPWRIFIVVVRFRALSFLIVVCHHLRNYFYLSCKTGSVNLKSNLALLHNKGHNLLTSAFSPKKCKINQISVKKVEYFPTKVNITFKQNL